MRFISTNPEFSLSGTLFIVGVFGFAGLTQSAAYLGRRAELPRRRLTVVRTLTVAGLLPLGGAAGAPLLPTILLAPLAITERGWTQRVRAAVTVIAVLPMVRIAVWLFGELSAPRAIVGTGWMVALYAGIVWAAGFSLAPQQDGWRPPRFVRALGLAGLAAAAVFVILMVATFQS